MTNVIRGLVLIAVFVSGAALALEQPDYEVIDSADTYEIRRYAPYVVAEVDVTGSFKDAGNTAFQILAGYIFGDNRQGEKMAMTAPVESRRIGDTASATEPMSVAAPVLTAASAEGDAYRYAFVMEKQNGFHDLPTPNDERIRLRQVEGHTVAARRYSGRWTEARYAYNEAALVEALRNAGIAQVGEPMFARYSAPFTPWFLRRNEVIVEVDLPADVAMAEVSAESE